MKKLTLCFVATMMAVGLASCTGNKENTKAVESVSLDRSEVTLLVEDFQPLVATVLPEDATNKNVTWSSDNPAIAGIDANGNIIAINEGTTTVTVRTEDGGKEAKCTVTVGSIKVESVTFDQDRLLGYVGEENVRIKATVEPETAYNKDLTWASSNADIVSVDENGYVTFLTPGEVTVTATALDGSGKSASCTVKSGYEPLKIELDAEMLYIPVEETATLTATITPDTGVLDPTIIWTVDNTNIATVDEDGVITGECAGVAAVTATVGNVSATCDIVVTQDGWKESDLAVIEEFFGEGFELPFFAYQWFGTGSPYVVGIATLTTGEKYFYYEDAAYDSFVWGLEDAFKYAGGWDMYSYYDYEGDYPYDVFLQDDIVIIAYPYNYADESSYGNQVIAYFDTPSYLTSSELTASLKADIAAEEIAPTFDETLIDTLPVISTITGTGCQDYGEGLGLVTLKNGKRALAYQVRTSAETLGGDVLDYFVSALESATYSGTTDKVWKSVSVVDNDGEFILGFSNDGSAQIQAQFSENTKWLEIYIIEANNSTDWNDEIETHFPTSGVDGLADIIGGKYFSSYEGHKYGGVQCGSMDIYGITESEYGDIPAALSGIFVYYDSLMSYVSGYDYDVYLFISNDGSTQIFAYDFGLEVILEFETLGDAGFLDETEFADLIDNYYFGATIPSLDASAQYIIEDDYEDSGYLTATVIGIDSSDLQTEVADFMTALAAAPYSWTELYSPNYDYFFAKEFGGYNIRLGINPGETLGVELEFSIAFNNASINNIFLPAHIRTETKLSNTIINKDGGTKNGGFYIGAFTSSSGNYIVQMYTENALLSALANSNIGLLTQCGYEIQGRESDDNTYLMSSDQKTNANVYYEADAYAEGYGIIQFTFQDRGFYAQDEWAGVEAYILKILDREGSTIPEVPTTEEGYFVYDYSSSDEMDVVSYASPEEITAVFASNPDWDRNPEYPEESGYNVWMNNDKTLNVLIADWDWDWFGYTWVCIFAYEEGQTYVDWTADIVDNYLYDCRCEGTIPVLPDTKVMVTESLYMYFYGVFDVYFNCESVDNIETAETQRDAYIAILEASGWTLWIDDGEGTLYYVNDIETMIIALSIREDDWDEEETPISWNFCINISDIELYPYN